jgi:hypothetical protein
VLRVAAVLLVLLAAHHSMPAGRDTGAPRLLDFRATGRC